MLVGVMGRMGQGKTLSMTALGIAIAKMTHSPLFANYDLKGVSFNRVRSRGDLFRAQSGIVLFDEIHIEMDSRQWKDTNNVNMSRWIHQTRKKDLIVFFTTQHIRQVDVRVRRALDWLIMTQKTPQGIWLSFVDYQYGIIGKKVLISQPKRFYGLYDTYQFPEPLTN